MKTMKNVAPAGTEVPRLSESHRSEHFFKGRNIELYSGDRQKAPYMMALRQCVLQWTVERCSSWNGARSEPQQGAPCPSALLQITTLNLYLEVQVGLYIFCNPQAQICCSCHGWSPAPSKVCRPRLILKWNSIELYTGKREIIPHIVWWTEWELMKPLNIHSRLITLYLVFKWEIIPHISCMRTPDETPTWTRDLRPKDGCRPQACFIWLHNTFNQRYGSPYCAIKRIGDESP